jgi:hypothetical protein
MVTKEIMILEMKYKPCIFFFRSLSTEFTINYILMNTLYILEVSKDNKEILKIFQEYYKKEKERFQYIIFKI